MESVGVPMKLGNVRGLAIAVGSFATILCFQNCGQPVAFSEQSKTSSLAAQESLNFDLAYPPSGIIGDQIQMSVKNAFVTKASAVSDRLDQRTFKVQPETHVQWSFRPADSATVKPIEITGNPAVISAEQSSIMELGVYHVTVKVELNGHVRLKNFTFLLNDKVKSCSSPEKSFILNGPSRLALEASDASGKEVIYSTSSQFSISDLNDKLKPHRSIDDLLKKENCYVIVKKSITWSQEKSAADPVVLGVGNPYIIKFDQLGIYNVKAEFEYYDATAGTTSVQKFTLSKKVSIESSSNFCKMVLLPEINPYISIPAGKITAGDFIELKAHITACSDKQLQIARWIVDGADFKVTSKEPATSIIYHANKPGNHTASLEYKLQSGETGTIETTFYVDEASGRCDTKDSLCAVESKEKD